MTPIARSNILSLSSSINEPSPSSLNRDSLSKLPYFQEIKTEPGVSTPTKQIKKSVNLEKKSSLKTPQINSSSILKHQVRWSTPLSSIRIIPSRDDLLQQSSTSSKSSVVENTSGSGHTHKHPDVPFSGPKSLKTLPQKFNISPTGISITRLQNGPTPDPNQDLNYIEIRNAATNLLKPHHSVPAFIWKRPTRIPPNEQTARSNLAHLAKALEPPNLEIQGSASSHQDLVLPNPTPTDSTFVNSRLENTLAPKPQSLSTYPSTTPSTTKTTNASLPTILPSANPTPPLGSSSLEGSSATKRKAQIDEVNPRPPKLIKVQQAQSIINLQSRLHSLNNLQSTTDISVVGDDDVLNGEEDSDAEEPPPSDEEIDSGGSNDDVDDDDCDIDSLFDGGNSPRINDTENHFEEVFSISDQPTCATRPTNDVGLTASEGNGRAPHPPTPTAVVDGFRVQRWMEHLQSLVRLRDAGPLHPKYAENLYQHLQHINTHKNDPYLDVTVLKNTGLGRMLKQFRHGMFERRSRLVADEITKYWRQMCREG